MADERAPVTAKLERSPRATHAAAPDPERIDESDILGTLETDRFCEECAFNMRSAPVFREPRTAVLMVRCTECGKLHGAATLTTASRLWLSRLASILMIGWVVVALGFLFLAGLAETGLHAVTLDEAIEWRRGGGAPVVIHPSEDADFRAMLYTVFPVSVGVGFLSVTLVGAAASHWKKWGYVALAVILPAIPAGIAWNVTRHDTPELLGQVSIYLWGHYAAQAVGGLMGAILGRPLVRLLVRVLVPPRLRSALAYLWLVDKLPPPGVAIAGSAPVKGR